MKKIIYNTSVTLASLILHYAAFVENITFFQIVLYIFCISGVLALINSAINEAVAEKYASIGPLDWCSSFALVATNLYIAHQNKTYFYFYLLVNIALYGTILCKIFNNDKSNECK